MKDHDESKLPKWAQERFELICANIRGRDAIIEQLKSAHAILFESKSWFTVPGPPQGERRHVYRLWFLDRDSPFPVCSLGPNDRLLVGRFGDDPVEVT